MDITVLLKRGERTFSSIGLIFLLGIAPSILLAQQQQTQSELDQSLVMQENKILQQDGAVVEELKQVIELDLINVSVERALMEIAQKADLKLMYSKALLPPEKKVTLHNKNITLYNALWKVLDGTDIRFALSGSRQLILLKMQKSESTKVTQETIAGLVTDAQSGDPMPAVNVAVKGTTIGTSTDKKGRYELEVPSLQDTLVFSFVGYKTQEVLIKGRTEINITLEPKTITGKEIVVVGYGQQQRHDLTSSITSVSGEDIAKVPAANIGNTLFGTSGLQVIQSTGQPGQDAPSIFVRGISSLSAGRSRPIYVLDGVVMQDARSIMQLDPDNIASVSVLKDASATAVYGVEGANGVIVVTTKRGREGTMDISVNTSAGLQAPTFERRNVSSYVHARAHNQAQRTDGVAPDQLAFTPEVLEAFRTGSNPLIYPDVDWVDYMTKPAAFQSRTNISISGGTGDVRYYIAGGYLKQDGFMKDFDTDAAFDDYENSPTYDRYNLRSNLDIDVTPSTQLSMNATGRVGSRVNVRGLNWVRLYKTQPFASVGIVDGKKVVSGDRYIPVKSHRDGFDNSYGNGYDQHIRSVLNLQLSATQQLDGLTEGLQLQLKGAYNAYFTQHKRRDSNVPTYVPYYRTDVDPSAPGDSTVVYRKQGVDRILRYSENYNKDRDWYVEARLQYSRNFGPHGVEGLLLYGQRKRYYPSQYPGIPRGLINTVGRFNYNYDDRYLLEVSMGYNGSENFAEGRRFGFFPAVSGGWILTNEPYFPELPFLDFLKLRASYGVVGNDSGIGRFLYLPTNYNVSAPGYNFGNAVPQDKPGASEGQIGNPMVTWEVARKQNYGIDLRLFGDRMDLSFDYFYEFREDILTTRNTMPVYVAANLPVVNLGEVENWGYEAEITWQHQVGDFFYSIGGNVTFARNKVVYTDEIPRSEPYQRRTGHPVGQPFGYVFNGFYGEDDFVAGTLDENLTGGELKDELPQPNWSVQPGFLKYKDLNEDGKVDQDDTHPIGYPRASPEYSFGANLNFRYKNVDLSMMWAAATNVSDLLLGPPNRVALGVGGGATMRQWQWERRWTPEKAEKNPEDILYPRFSLAAGRQRDNHHSDFWLIDASYLRLKSVEIGYTFSQDIASALGARGLRVYANAYNPLTFSSMMETYGLDPEGTGHQFNAQYPIMKVYSVGVKLDF